MRWIRLDLTWSHSVWLSVLSAESRLAWIELLCYVKGYGSAGRARAITPDRFARMIYVGEESVRQMLKAAEADGALAIDGGDWLICKWAKYQGDETGAERQARFKANRKAEKGNGGNALVTVVTVTETETETSLVEIDSLGGAGGAKSKPKAVVRPAGFTRPTKEELAEYFVSIDLPKSEARAFWDHYEANGWKVGKNAMKNWQASARNWKRNHGTFAKPKADTKRVSDDPPAEYVVQ